MLFKKLSEITQEYGCILICVHTLTNKHLIVNPYNSPKQVKKLMIFLKMFGKLKAITYRCSLNTKIPPVSTGWLSNKSNFVLMVKSKSNDFCFLKIVLPIKVITYKCMLLPEKKSLFGQPISAAGSPTKATSY